MAAVTTTLLPPRPPGDSAFRWTVQQYHKMIESGLLTEDDPVELIEGQILFKMPKNDPHIIAVRSCRHILSAILPAGYFYDSEQPITLADSEPEPDGFIARGAFNDPKSAKPGADQLALVIEVANSSLDRDRDSKLRSYARAGIVCYWIINLVDRQIEIYTQPDAAAEPPRYSKTEVLKPGDEASVVIDGKAVGKLPVGDMLPA